jgi:hypothetical protein
MLQLFQQIIAKTEPCLRFTGSVGYYDENGFVHWTVLREYLMTYHNDDGRQSIWVHSTFPFNYCYKLDGGYEVYENKAVYGIENGMFMYIQEVSLEKSIEQQPKVSFSCPMDEKDLSLLNSFNDLEL